MTCLLGLLIIIAYSFHYHIVSVPLLTSYQITVVSQQLLDDDFSFEPEEDMVPLRNAITKSLMVSKGATTAD